MNAPILKGLTADSKIARTNTRVAIQLQPHRDDPLFVTRPATVIDIPGSDAAKHQQLLRHFHWAKTMGQAAGHWTAIIKDKPPYVMEIGEGSVLPGDWAKISVQRNGVDIPLCWGPVESVREIKDTSNRGLTTRTYALAGKDHGAAFEMPMAYATIWVRTLIEIVAGIMTERVKGEVGGSPDKMFKLLIDAALGPGSKAGMWRLPESLTSQGLILWDVLSIKNRSDRRLRGSYWNEIQLWTQPGQTLHGSLQWWCFVLLHELWYDWNYSPTDREGMTEWPRTIGTRMPVAANIRERPFPSTVTGLNGAWFSNSDACLTWELPRWLCRNADLQRSNAERINLIELLADLIFTGSTGDQQAMYPPAHSRESVEKYGLRPMQEHTHFVAENGSEGNWGTERAVWQKLLTDWYAINPWLMSGSLTFPLALPEIRIGSRLVLKSDNDKTQEQFYVEGVEIDWTGIDSPTTPARSSTVFHVTRGWKGDDHSLMSAVTAAADEFTQIKGAGAS